MVTVCKLWLHTGHRWPSLRPGSKNRLRTGRETKGLEWYFCRWPKKKTACTHCCFLRHHGRRNDRQEKSRHRSCPLILVRSIRDIPKIETLQLPCNIIGEWMCTIVICIWVSGGCSVNVHYSISVYNGRVLWNSYNYMTTFMRLYIETKEKLVFCALHELFRHHLLLYRIIQIQKVGREFSALQT